MNILSPFNRLILFFILFNTACNPIVAANDETASPAIIASQSEKNIPRINLLYDVEQLQQAQILLQQRPEFSGNTVQVFEKIHFFDGIRPRIELAVKNPALTNALTFYTYEQGKWTPSEAEDISHIKQLNQHLIDLNSLDFRQVSRLAHLWQQQAHSIQAAIQEPYYVAFIFLPKQNKRFWHTAILETTGEQYYLSFHENGSVWENKSLNHKTNHVSD